MEFIDEDNFKADDRISKFFAFCTKILDEYNIEHKCNKIVNMSLKQHKNAFIDIYEDNLDSILAGFKSVDWIQNDVVLAYKYEGNIKYTLDITQIYNSTCKFVSNNEKRFKKYPSLSNEKMYELQYSKIFLFLLYSCYEIFCPPSDRQAIRVIIQDLKTYIKSFGKQDQTNMNSPFDFGNVGTMISSVINIAKEDKRIGSFFEKNNIPIDSVISNLANSMSKNNGDIKSMVHGVLSAIPIPEEDEISNISNSSNSNSLIDTSITSFNNNTNNTSNTDNGDTEVFDI